MFILVIAVLYRYMFMEGSDGHVRNDYRDACLVLLDFSMDAIYIFEQIFRQIRRPGLQIVRLNLSREEQR